MKSLTNFRNARKMSNETFVNHIQYNKYGYYIHGRRRQKEYPVTVVLPVCNNETTLANAVDSILCQSLGMGNIELLLIDDASDDRSRVMALDYADTYPTITPVFLEHNTGTPGGPRNLGIQLARGKYIMFLDADDWLSERGTEALYDLLEETGNHYAVGATIKLTDKGQKIVSEYNSRSLRKSVDPFDIKRIFYHVGPTGRMMRTSFIRENNVRFPEMRFAEDKYFFIDVFTSCGNIATSPEVIYYVNRYQSNVSFTDTTTVFEKTDMNIQCLRYVMDKQLPVEKEQLIVNRLIEFDCITRLFDRGHFLQSQEQEKYFEKFKDVLAAAENLRYRIKDIIHVPWHRFLLDLFQEGRYQDIVALIQWSRQKKTKPFAVKDNLPYYVMPFTGDEKYIRINVLAVYDGAVPNEDSYTIYFKCYGDLDSELESLVARHQENDLQEITFPVHHDTGSRYYAEVPYERLIQLAASKYTLFLRYDHFRKIPIKMNARGIIQYQAKRLDFYTTVNDNLAFRLD